MLCFVHIQCSINLEICCYSKIAMLALVIQSHTTQKWMSDMKKMQKCTKIEKIVEQSFLSLKCCEPIISILEISFYSDYLRAFPRS